VESLVVAKSFESGLTTVTESLVDGDDDLSYLSLDDNDLDDDSEDNVMPGLKQIVGGFYDKENGECKMKLKYEDEPNKIVIVAAIAAIEDEYNMFNQRTVLHWIMKNKRGDKWKKELSTMIESNQNEEFFPDWVDWDSYVKGKVEEGVLDSKCLVVVSTTNLKGGCDLVPAESPLQVKKECCVVHSFKEETKKEQARKDKGYILSGVVCQGSNNNCGNEFVEMESDATDPKKAYIVSRANIAWWCHECHLVYCNPCFQLYCNANTSLGARKRKRLQF
jgi:hypothetical protein